MPHLELAHHSIHKSKTYNDYCGIEALHKIGKKRWNRRVLRMTDILYALLHYDQLFIGGGNATKIELDLPRHTSIVSNDAGIEGGAAPWRGEDEQIAR